MPLPRLRPFRKDPPIASPHSARPRSGPGAPTWVRYSAIDHQLWLICTAVAVVPIGLPVLVGGIYVGLVQDPSMFAAALLPGPIIAMAMVFYPYFFCEHGIEVDEQGLRLRKKPKWWYRGVTLDVPWSVVRGLTVIRHHPGRLDRQVLVILLERDTGRRASFSWVDIEVPGSVNGLAGYSPGFRIVTLGRQAEVDAMIDAVLAQWPDLPVEETSTNPHRPMPARTLNVRERAEGTALVHPEPDVRPRPEPDRERHEPPTVGVDEFVSHRDAVLLPAYGLIGVGAFAILVGLLYPFGLFTTWRAGNSVGDTALALSPFLFVGLVGLVFLGFRLRLLPRQAARQGVRVHPEGITLSRDPRWWAEGVDIELPWADITGIRTDVRTHKKRQRSRVIITLADFDDTRPLPAWASTFWDTVLDEPTVVIDSVLMVHPGFGRYRLVPALYEARPDLFR